MGYFTKKNWQFQLHSDQTILTTALYEPLHVFLRLRTFISMLFTRCTYVSTPFLQAWFLSATIVALLLNRKKPKTVWSKKFVEETVRLGSYSMHTYLYVFIHHTHTHTRLHTYTYIHTYIHNTYMHASMHASMHAYIHTHTHTHIYIFIHMQTHVPNSIQPCFTP